MKSKTIYILTFFTTVALVLMNSCGGSDPEPEETEVEKATKLLVGTWSVQSVTVDGVNQTAIYQNLEITFTNASITATNGGSLWPPTSSWQFANDAATSIARGDGVNVSIAELTSSRLVLDLTWNKTTLGGGRAESISGRHTLVFTKR